MSFAPALAFDYLRRAYDADRLGHAYLLVGAQPAELLAWRLAAMVVQAKPEGVRSHPDVHLVEPESKSRRIVVEQMRELENALRLRASTAGGRKVGIIREADRLQVQASNAFLKTLEEPPSSSLLLLVSAQPESLMETILSRCIKVVLQTPADAAVDQSEEGRALLALVERQFAGRTAESGAGTVPNVGTAYRMLREFTGLLGAVRSRLQAEAETNLEREQDQYAKTTDGTWLAERESYYKALTEARYVAERARLVETLGRWWGNRLRALTTSGIGEPNTVADLLRRLSTLDQLRENLDRNIQEALALEVAFLQVFG